MQVEFANLAEDPRIKILTRGECLYIIKTTMKPFRSTTIIAVQKDGKVALAGDGQATSGDSTVMKGNVRKVRRIADGKAIVGFAGSTADAFTLMEVFEAQLKKSNWDITRASVDTAKQWRSDKALRHLEAMMLVTDGKKIFLISGAGDVIEPEDNVMAIGSGGNYALSAARAINALSDEFNLKLSASSIAERALRIASKLCVYTNDNIIVEEMDE